MAKEKTEFVGCRIPISMRAKIKIAAEKADSNESAIIRQALRLFFLSQKINKDKQKAIKLR